MKRNYKFVIKDCRGKEIKAVCGQEWNGLTSEQARWLVLGIRVGLFQKYKRCTVELYDADTNELIFVQH